MVKRTGLGKNLSALLGSSTLLLEKNETKSSLQILRTEHLKPSPYQPRVYMNDEALQELADSIKKQGLLQPIVVRKLEGDCHEIIAGERRYRASILAGLQEVQVIVKEADDETAMALALIENLQREDLNPVEQARAMARLVNECGMTHQEVSEILSKSRASVSNFLRLLSLAPEVMRFLENGDLDMGHARTLLVFSHEEQVCLAEKVVSENLSVRECERLVDRMKKEKDTTIVSKKIFKLSEWGDSLKVLRTHLHAGIEIKSGKKGSGKLIIPFDSKASLETIIQSLIKANATVSSD